MAPTLQHPPEPVSLARRRAWDAMWRWLLSPAPETEDRPGEREPVDLSQEREWRAERDRSQTV